MKTLRITTRKSPLALWQAEEVARRLQALHPGLNTELVKISTRGDKILDSPLSKIGGKGLFVKELEQCLFDGSADIAVHSMKDVPMELPDGLHLPVILERGDPADAFVSNRFERIEDMGDGRDLCLGSSSLRRQSQMRARFPALTVDSLRGNVGTRLGKLDDGMYHAIVLAASGLKRLELENRIRQRIPYDICLPAIGQGALGIECRQNDPDVESLISPLHHADSAVCVLAERALNRRLHGGCQVPIAGYAELTADNRVYLRGRVADPSGEPMLKAERTGSRDSAEAVGIEVAEALLEQGAGPILAACGMEVPES